MARQNGQDFLHSGSVTARGLRRNLLPPLLYLLLPVSPAVLVQPTVAQSIDGCLPPAGADVEALRNPPVTAQDVAANPRLLEDFIVNYRDETKALEQDVSTGQEYSVYIACIAREKDGPWYSDSVYMVSLTPDGRVLVHAKDMSLSGRRLKPEVYAAILANLGITAEEIAALGSSDPVVAGQALPGIFAKLSADPDGAFSVGGAGIPAASGHAAAYYRSAAQSPIILLSGFDLTEAYFVDFSDEDISYGNPSVKAKDVVDRETLKRFVMAAADYIRTAFETGDPSAQSKARVPLRDPNGPWKHGSIYLYVYDSRIGQTVFNGGFPDRFEFRSAGITQDVVTGELVWDLVTEAAARSPEGGFLSYHFDNPDDDSDEAVPKIGYALELSVPVTLQDGREETYEFIIGSGFYPEGVAAAEAITSEALACPAPAGANVAALRNPPIRASEATTPQGLQQFILHYRDEAKKLEDARIERDSVYTACIARDKDGPYYSDSIYTVSLTLDGRVLIHAKDMRLSARQLNPQIYATILAQLGVPAEAIANLGSSDPAVAGSALGAVVAKLSEEPDGAFSFDEQSGIPAASGHAAVYTSSENLGSPPIILIAGFDLTEAHLVEEDIDHHAPSIEAKDVVDRDTLKQFVSEAADYMGGILGTGDPGAHSRARLELRDPNGPWKHGSIYLYVYDKVTQQTVLNGGFPDRFEFRNAGITRDVVTGELVWDLVTEAAARSPEGGFLSYHFDNPATASDEAVPKVGYARELEASVTQPDGTTFTYEFILGSGFYPEDVAAAEQLKSTSLKAWHVRFGRTVSQQVVDALQDRFAAPPQAGLQLTVAGERLNSTTPLEDNQEALAKLLGFETVSSRQLVQDSSFSFTTSEDRAPAQFSLWGAGALSSFSGKEDSVSLDGAVTTAILGADWSGARWRAGAALAQSWGSGSYDGDGENDADITTTLTSVFPYGRYALTPRLGVWATAGYGWGALSLKPDGAEYNPDTTMAMAAVGMDGLLLDGGATGFNLSAMTDVLVVKTTTAGDEELDASEGNISRLRLGLEATRPVPLANGASLLPSMTLGLRHDGGDAETGFGMDLGAGISWSAPKRGITAELKGRTLLAHADEDFQDQGLAISFSWDPNPSALGPSLSMRHSMGAAPSGGMDALLNPVTMELPAAASSGQQLETRLAYGWAIFDDRLTLTPALGLALSPDSRRYSLLWALQPHSSHQDQPDAWQLSLDVQRWEKHSATSPVDHSLKLGFSLSL